MRSNKLFNRTWLSVMGVATALTTTAATLAPVSVAATTASDTGDNAQPAHADKAADGTYESCEAYFAFGKQPDALDIVEFDVADENGSDGVAHAVPTDTQVVLVLTNEAGDELRCTPFEVTEAMWNDALDDLYLNYNGYSPDHPLPAWPGPGHYAYPSINFGPYVSGHGVEPGTDFGDVTAVGFEVTSIPGDHSLVSPVGIHPLDVHYPTENDSWSTVEDPLVIAYLTSVAGAAAAAAFNAALPKCEAEDPFIVDSDLTLAINTLNDFRGYDSVEPSDIDCWTVGSMNAETSFQLDLGDIQNYVEPIRLRVPESPTSTTDAPTTTTTTTTTTPAVKSEAAAATPVVATPVYTG